MMENNEKDSMEGIIQTIVLMCTNPYFRMMPTDLLVDRIAMFAKAALKKIKDEDQSG